MPVRDRRNLPTEVISRLGDAGALQRGHLLEDRRRSVEIRRSDSGPIVLVGYATTWDQPYEVYGGPPWGWLEVMARGAWDKTLVERDDVRLLVNHDGVPLARTRSGTLRLTADELGLLVEADLDAASPTVQGLVSAMDRGDIDQMSCAFEVLTQEWSPDWETRKITEVKGWDVSVVTYPANEATMALVGAAASRSALGSGRGVDIARRELALLRL